MNKQDFFTSPARLGACTYRKLIWSFAFLCTLSLGHWSFAAPAKPNIVFIFADDLTYEAIRAFGHTDIDTPNLDKLVSRGTTFTHAYNMGSWSGAVCVASRTMLVTGRSVWDAQRIYNATDKERQAGVLWPQLMEKAGYDTYFTGKWHVQTDANKVFKVARHIRAGMPTTVESAYNRPLSGQDDEWSPYDKTLGGFWEGGKHWSEVVADDATDYLKEAGKADKPFFMYLAFNAPHDPRQTPKEFVDMYPPNRIEVPKNFMPEYPFKDAIGCGKTLRDERLGPFPRTEHSIKVHRGEYYALITHMDQQIGRILKALGATGKADNTWVIFTADHGLAVGHHGLFGKQNMYDHSVRVPFIVAGPGVPEGRKIDSPIYLQDAMATSLEIAGATRPDHVWFHSLLPLLQGKTKKSAHDEVYGAYLQLQRSITLDGMKLIVYPKAKKARLYDLKRDPMEMKDLSEDPKQKPLMGKLLAHLVTKQRELGDSLDLLAELPDGKHGIERGRLALRTTRDRLPAICGCYVGLIFYSWWAGVQIVMARAPIGEFSNSGMFGNVLSGIGCLLSISSIWVLSRNHWVFRFPFYAGLLFWIFTSYELWSSYGLDWWYFKRHR